MIKVEEKIFQKSDTLIFCWNENILRSWEMSCFWNYVDKETFVTLKICNESSQTDSFCYISLWKGATIEEKIIFVSCDQVEILSKEGTNPGKLLLTQ